MNNKEINEAVAKACGWTHIQLAIHPDTLHGRPPVQGHFIRVPNYATSLDACAEFERTLELRDLADYSYKLMDITNTTYEAITATARQRCEAYLRMKGLWIEDKGDAK